MHNTVCPANSYYSNQTRQKFKTKAILSYILLKKRKEKKHSNMQKETLEVFTSCM